jgi:hypothetical protein
MYGRTGRASTLFLFSGLFCSGQAPRIAERPPQKKLDLGVDAAEVISGPAPQGVQDLGVQSQEKGLALGHV